MTSDRTPREALLPLSHYRLKFEAQSVVELPPFAGSAWRGAFGHALKESCCIFRDGDCHHCPLTDECSYAYLFETPPPEGSAKLRRYPAAPHPFVLRPEVHDAGPLPPGQPLRLDLILIGRAARHLPFILHALRAAAARGIGRGTRTGMGRCRLRTLQCLSGGGGPQIPTAEFDPHRLPLPTPLQVPPPPDRVTLHIETPLRLNRDGELVGAKAFRFHDLFRNLLRRTSLLSYFHTERPLETDFAELTLASREVPIQGAELHWHDWSRWSSRQGRPVAMGGLVGSVTLAGSDLAPFWGYLWQGQWLHAGKGAAMGMGRYRIETATSL